MDPIRIALVAAMALTAAPTVLAAESELAAVTPVRYDLGVELDFERGVMHGRCRMRLRSLEEHAVEVVSLMLYRTLATRRVALVADTPVDVEQSIVSFDDVLL